MNSRSADEKLLRMEREFWSRGTATIRFAWSAHVNTAADCADQARLRSRTASWLRLQLSGERTLRRFLSRKLPIGTGHIARCALRQKRKLTPVRKRTFRYASKSAVHTHVSGS